MSREAQELLSDAALATFKLNGRVLALAEEITRPAGLTAAWWQVLGGVIRRPRTVSDVAREMGVTRQSVQRVADLLVDRGLATYEDNPAHRRAKLLAPSAAGRRAIDALDPGHAAAADQLVDELGATELHSIISAMRSLTAALERMEQRREHGPASTKR